MLATVKFILPSRRRGAVLTERRDFSIFEFASLEDLGMEDQLAWPDADPLGPATVDNKTRGTQIQVSFRRHQVAAAQVGAALVEV